MKDTAQLKQFIQITGCLVFETFSVKAGNCACAAAGKCASPGKHPKAKNWQRSLKSFGNSMPLLEKVLQGECNYGIATNGQAFVLDFDGEVGCKVFDYLASVIPSLRRASRVRTQSGGLHVYVHHALGDSRNIRNKTKHLPGMDVRGQGGFVIGPGSTGVGGCYVIEQLSDTDCILSKSDLEALLLHPNLPKLDKKYREISDQGQRNEKTFKALCSLRALGCSAEQLKSCSIGVNAFNNPPLDRDEVVQIVGSASGYEQKSQSRSRKPFSEYETADASGLAFGGYGGDAGDEVLPLVVDELRGEMFAGVVRLNEFSDEIVFDRWLPQLNVRYEDFRSRKFNDLDSATLRDLFTRRLGKSVSADSLSTAIFVIASENRFHPVRTYLGSLTWDSKPRVCKFFFRCFGAEDNEYSALVSRCFLLSMVARVMNPGCKVDTVPILEGPQGIGKSEGLRALGGVYFGDPCLDLTNKDSCQQILGLWLVEFAELASLRRKGASATKAFITRRIDRYRPAYGRFVKDQPRQCVFVGTTNESHYLDDPTGNRRFLPIKVTRADVAAIDSDRDQIFAEAFEMFKAGVSWWPEGTETELASREQGLPVETDPWEDRLGQVLNSEQAPRNEISAIEVFGMLGIPENFKDKDKQTRVGQIMRSLGWVRKRDRKNGTTYQRMPQTEFGSTSHLCHLILTSTQETRGHAPTPETSKQRICFDLRNEVEQVGEVEQ